MATKAAELFAEVGAETSQYERKMRQAGQTFDKTTRDMKQQADQMAGAIAGGLGGIAGALGVGGALMLGKQVVGVTWELAQAGMQAQALERNFVALSGEGVESINGLRQATRGLISDTQLMQASNKYMAMGLAKNSEEAGKLINTFAQLAIVLGRDVSGAIDESAQLLANQSMMRLDQFGMSSARVKERIEDLKKAQRGLSDESAFMQAVMAEADATLGKVGDQAGQSVSKIAELEASWENLRSELGRQIDAAIVITVVANAVEGMTEGLRTERGARETVAPFKEIMKERAATDYYANESAYAAEKRAIRDVEVALQRKGITEEQAIDLLTERLGLVEEELRLIGAGSTAMTEQEQQVRDMARRYEELETAAWQAGGAMFEAAVALGQSLPGRTGDPWLDNLLAHPGIRPHQDDDYERRDREALAATRKRMEDRSREAERLALERQSNARQQQAQLRSLVEGVLQPTQVTDLDMARTQLGTYTDQWDEHVRRVRSAATDAKSAWRDMIPVDVLARGADAVKVWAAETEEAFYAGQAPDMVNWDAVIADVEKQMRYQAGREALVQEAMQRARAAGLGVSIGQVREALGVGQTYSEIGADVASGMTAGMGGVNIAAQVTTTFEADLKKQQERYVTQGQLMVSWLATGAKEGAPALATDLALALFPALQRLFANASPRL